MGNKNTENDQTAPDEASLSALNGSRSDTELLADAVRLLARWCVHVEDRGTYWDDWDECYKDANYRPGPLRELIDKAKEEARHKWPSPEEERRAWEHSENEKLINPEEL